MTNMRNAATVQTHTYKSVKKFDILTVGIGASPLSVPLSTSRSSSSTARGPFSAPGGHISSNATGTRVQDWINIRENTKELKSLHTWTSQQPDNRERYDTHSVLLIELSIPTAQLLGPLEMEDGVRSGLQDEPLIRHVLPYVPLAVDANAEEGPPCPVNAVPCLKEDSLCNSLSRGT